MSFCCYMICMYYHVGILLFFVFIVFFCWCIVTLLVPQVCMFCHVGILPYDVILLIIMVVYWCIVHGGILVYCCFVNTTGGCSIVYSKRTHSMLVREHILCIYSKRTHSMYCCFVNTTGSCSIVYSKRTHSMYL